MDNGLHGPGRSHPGGAIPKTSNSKFYGDFSFEDDFNPSSLRGQQTSPNVPTQEDDINPSSLRGQQTSTNAPTQLMNNHRKEESQTVAAPTNDTLPTNSTDGLEKNDTSPRFCASPLMCYVVRLKRGEELRKSLLSFAKKNGLKAAFIMTCVGSATSAKIRVASATADNEANYMLDIVHPTEIVSVEGTLSGGGHLHVALSDSTGKIVGGHLLELTIDTTAEVVIGECSAISFSRVFDNSTGFHELNVSKR